VENFRGKRNGTGVDTDGDVVVGVSSEVVEGWLGNKP